jgi:regulator of nucleoside diphosphate kinase
MAIDRVRLTEADARRLQGLVAGRAPHNSHDDRMLAQLEERLEEAEVVPEAHVGPDVITMDSDVRVTDLATGEAFVFRVVFPRQANASAGRISVLAPLGLAVLGRTVGEEVESPVPGGLRRLRIEARLERRAGEGRDVA